MGVLDRFYDNVAAKIATKMEVNKPIVKEDINSQSELEALAKNIADGGVKAWEIPRQFNTKTGRVQKHDSSVTFRQLRQLSVNYPIARSCIHYLKTKIVALDWAIVSTDEEDTSDNSKEIERITEFFKRPEGHKSKLKGFLKKVLEDAIVLDAVALYRQQTFGKELLNLWPVDAATIQLQLTEEGITPEPPDIAYKQVIFGQTVAKLTTDELIYEVSNPRSNSPYGLAPLESLIIQATSALKGSMYNLGFLTDGNVPEGFIELPEDVAKSPDRAKEWLAFFDNQIAGDPKQQRRLKLLPAGSKYVPSKKPDDMSFERFEKWLLQQTCSIFGVPPQDIGFTFDINRATGEVQQSMGQERGMRPWANFLKEILDDVIQVDLGAPGLQWNWLNLDPTDLKEEAEVAKTEINIGTKSINEYRKEQGRERVDGGDEPFILTSGGPVLVKDIEKADQNLQDINSQTAAPEEESPADNFEREKSELKKWKKKAIKRFKAGQDITKFESDILDTETVKTIKEFLKLAVKDEGEIREVFDGHINKQDKIFKGLLALHDDLTEVTGE